MPRYALFLTPLPGDDLDAAAARWLGRDVYADTEPKHPRVEGLGPDELAELTHTARRYGFHGTMKAPFHLAPGVSEANLVTAFHDYCLTVPNLTDVRLRLGDLGGFLALVPDGPSPEIDALARDVVARFDPFRAPLTRADIARRDPERLSPEEVENLHRWGYPYVMDAFRYHMTLTARIVDAAERARVAAAAESWFGHVVRSPLRGLALALFVERDPGAFFTVLSWRQLALTGASDRVA